MEILELNANERVKTGKGQARVLRRGGRIPAVLYGPKTQPLSLSIDNHELELLIKNAKSRQQLVNLVIGGGTTKRVGMIKELQRHPVSKNFLHADFYEVDMDRKIRANVAIKTKGKSKGVELGGMLQIVRRELEVLCLPNRIPESIVLDVTEMEIGDAIHVEDIQLEEGVEIPHEVNFTVVTLLAQKKETLEVEEEVEGEEGIETEESAEEENSED